MVHTIRKYIDKHWLTFLFRGGLALVMGSIALFGRADNLATIVTYMSIFLLIMGIIDSVSALYSSTKKSGWLNAIFDAGIDMIAALALLFTANNDIAFHIVIIALYVLISGIIDIFHGFVSTVDPTDRFIRILAGMCGAVMGIVIFNAGAMELSTFLRFFGAYMLIVGICSLIYGVDNRKQDKEDTAARKEAAATRKKTQKAPASKAKKTTKTK